MISIPLPSDLTFFDVSVELDGAHYTLVMRWNVRAGAWFLDVLDDGGALLHGSVRAVADWPLLTYRRATRSPPGALAFVDTSGQGIDPGISDLGDRVQLVYFPVAEID